MGKRSLKASQLGIPKAKQAFRRTGWTQEYLAAEVGLETRQSIWKFFSGRPIERHLFIDICFQLGLDWEQIAELPQEEPECSAATISEVSSLVQTVRSQMRDSIQAQCGFLQTCLDIAHPLALNQIYTHLHVSPQLAHQRWLEVSDLQRNNLDGKHRLLPEGDQSIAAMAAVIAYSKLIILGKPGAGKTTFLQHIALECIEGQVGLDRIPIFVTLRHYAAEARKGGEFNIKNYICQQWSVYGLSEVQVESLLRQGQALVLLDGLDEIPQVDASTILCEIQNFAETYFTTSIVITGRLSAQEFNFHGFTTVELVDFSSSQIEAFVRRWFLAMNPASEVIGLTKANHFLEHLQYPENQPIQELVVTPILLHLACLVFQARETFPAKRAKLYQNGLDILMTRWDSARGIQRDSTEDSLSRSDQIKLLSQIAAEMLMQGKLFFEKHELLPIIAKYLHDRSNYQFDVETLWAHSESILKSIVLSSGLLVERAHEIYSFSHLTFQEYFTARYIVARAVEAGIGKQDATSLQMLADHVGDRRWYEVILLTVSLLSNADQLLMLMKQRIQSSLTGSADFRPFLKWVNQKSQTVLQHCSTTYAPVAVRALYFTVFQESDLKLDLATTLDPHIAFDPDPELELDFALLRILKLAQTLRVEVRLMDLLTLRFALDLEPRFLLPDNFRRSLEHLKNTFPTPPIIDTDLQTWWANQGEPWLMELHQILITHRSVGHSWNFNSMQRSQLKQYWEATKFLVRCINSECQVTLNRQQFIEDMLLIEAESTHSAIDYDTLYGLQDLVSEDRNEFLVKVVSHYLEDATDRLYAVENAVQQNDPDGLKLAAHAMRSLNTTIGASSCAQICEALEHLGKENTIQGAQTLLTQLKIEYKRVSIALHEELIEIPSR